MVFDILHTTDYRYHAKASEAYIETRLTPPLLAHQQVQSHVIEFAPDAPTSSYVDYFGNKVHFYSMTLRHERLTITNRLRVETRAAHLPGDALDVPLAEARQIINSSLTDVFDYLQGTETIPTGGNAKPWVRRFLKNGAPLRQCLENLNRHIYEHFEYVPGSTDNATPLAAVWRQRKGVCQDFAHILLSVLRTGGIPSRYVCGYIESAAPQTSGRSLVGSIATHAWVEVLIPGMQWVGIDPTNNCWCGDQHITVSYGRDFRDAAPVRGTFKTSGAQTMKVKVLVKRLSS